MNESVKTLEAWVALRDLSMAEIRKRFAMSAAHTTRDTDYLGLEGLTELYNPDAHPAHFYFRDRRCVLLYFEDIAAEVEALDPRALKAYLGKPAAVLASRASKQDAQYVYPGKGVAFSASNDHVSYLEIFPPATLEDYTARLYMTPPKFVE
jgi:hypothetical protein